MDVDMATVEGVDEDDALALAAAVESDSEHVIARAICEAADERDRSAPEATNFEAIKGRGVRANADGNEVYVGGPNLLTTSTARYRTISSASLTRLDSPPRQ